VLAVTTTVLTVYKPCVSETITLLNSDDALELFKGSLPGAASSFVQFGKNAMKQRASAVAAIRAAQDKFGKPARQHLDFIMLALRGQKVGFDKVIGMIDAMKETLKTEQTDDDDKKAYCAKAFDEVEDSKKGLEQGVSDAEAAAASAEEAIASLSAELKALNKGIAALDSSVADATEQRKNEHAEFSELIAQNSAAVELLGMAKNRLNKFYQPKLYVPASKRELSEEDRIAVNMGGTAPPTPAPGGIGGTGITALVQLSEHKRVVDAPPPPPESFSAYTKSKEHGGVIAMLDLLVKDLEKEITEAEVSEKNSQAEYEQMSADAAAMRAADASAIIEKGAAKASAEENLQAHEDTHASLTNELMANAEYTSSLHSDCDWLMQYYDQRKAARAGEIDALNNAKAVLSGADFSLMQTGAVLRGTPRS